MELANRAKNWSSSIEVIIATHQWTEKMGLDIVNGFSGSSIWNLLYSFPPVPDEMIEKGFEDFANRWKPICDACE